VGCAVRVRFENDAVGRGMGGRRDPGRKRETDEVGRWFSRVPEQSTVARVDRACSRGVWRRFNHQLAWYLGGA